MVGSEGVDFPWNHPLVAALDNEHRDQLEHARNLSEVFHGAALLYNLMLSEAATNEQYIAPSQEQLEAWDDQMTTREAEHRGWSLEAFWNYAKRGRIDA